MAQQTSVEWLQNQLTLALGDELKSLRGLFVVAKEIEKEQMITLLTWMNKVASEEPMRLETTHDDIVEQFYNETFKK